MFARLRSRLTLWYCSVLATALIIFGVALYIGVRQMLLSPIHSDVADRAARLQQEWQAFPALSCASTPVGVRFVPGIRPGSDGGLRLPRGLAGDTRFRDQVFSACFDARGSLLDAGGSATLPPGMLNHALALAALHHGSASDTVNGDAGIGQMYRYAIVAHDPNGNALGVIVASQSVQAQMDALQVLLELLLILGAITLLAAGVGGLFLSGRAIVPARLAFNRQQTFIADASHEFRTPLALLRADADILLRRRDRLAPEEAALVKDMAAETSHLGAMATTLLNLARLDSGQLRVERDIVDLSDMVNDIVRRAGVLAQASAIDLRAKTDSPALAIGDRVLIEQVLLTLLDNAMKYNRPNGSVTLSTGQQDGRASIVVCDTGIGIPPEHVPHLGERFYRVDKARSRASGGAGLGLSIARSIIDAHEGDITFSSRVGEGTTAIVSLPAARVLSPDRTSSTQPAP